MIYIANCYVGQYKPGEVFDTDIPEKELKRLLDKKAISPTGKTFQEVLAENDTENAAEQDGNSVDVPESRADDTDQESEDEADDEEAEAPEIDVMDGISAAEEENAESKGRIKRNRAAR